MRPKRFRSSIGKKALMAASGMALVLFLIGHLMGNLLIFSGPDAINAYALKLRKLGWLLWAARAGLLAAAIVHTVTSIQLAVENRRARPARYQVYRTAETNWIRRTMMLSGGLLLVYLAYHLLHFTFHATNPEFGRLRDALGHQDVYRMMVLGFSRPLVCIAYVLGVAAVCLHVSHGIGSAFQTLGLNNDKTLPVVTWAGRLLALGLFLGYSAIPLAVWAGVVQ